jgi:hypothetical protein
MKRNIAVAALALVSVALPACGGAGDSGGKNDEAKFQEAALKHAKCMRDNGIDFPDPKFENGGASVNSVREGDNPETMRRAEEKCKHFIDDVAPKQISEKERQELADQMLAHARCMRAQGIDFPDPKIDSKGRVTMEMRGRAGEKPDFARMQRAEEKCRPKGAGPGKGPMLLKPPPPK